MSMDYVRRTYGVPAKRGARVQCKTDGGWSGGVITSAGHYVVVKPDNQPNARLRYHPGDTDNLRYLNDE